MPDTYYVLHSGTGTDGGFGDYSPPRWSPEPVSVNGRTVWFRTEGEAADVVEALNRMSMDVFYEAGKSCQYDGYFPVEYEYRAIRVPSGPASMTAEGINLVAELHKDDWDYMPDYDEDDCDEGEEPLDWEAELSAAGNNEA